MAVRIAFNRLPSMARQLPARAAAVVRETLFAVQAEVKREMAQPKSGHVRDDGHVASAPGEAPAIDTGAYVNDIQVRVAGPARGIVGTNQEQAEGLEYGGAEVEARPVWRPVARAIEAQFERRLEDLGI